jgi:NAD(P)-dependent dehydrogenase (short-subunit alcohol dehydrogenase family)
MGYDGSDMPQPLGGIWAGFAKCLPRELPNLAVKVLDVDTPDAATIADVLFAELSTWDVYEIGYSGGVRHALSSRRAAAGPARISLDGNDVVLISGGARGVGFALARGLAERFGCRVVVTGRDKLPADQDWFAAPVKEYEQQRLGRIAAARSAAELRTVRASLDRERELRLVGENLRAARADGLRIEYEPCDCVDASQVAALFARLPVPTVIVHNAGIDDPKRLDAKTPDEVVRTVSVKVAGFANLVDQVLASPARQAALKVFCNVGSLAGRMGGMIGQIDYAAGNEALARLGFWARQAHGLPVQTVCWPTWERLGVIANYDAAVRYVSTIAPDEGVERWITELLSAGTDESMFIGQVGTALVPSQLRGFWLFTGHPDLPRLHAIAHFLGRVEEFEPHRRIRGTLTYPAGDQPCLAEFTVAGVPALPVSVLIEQACAVADWVAPPGWPKRHLAEIRDLVVHCGRLRLGAFHTEATGTAGADGWQVAVRVSDGAGDPVATMTLHYRPEPPVLPETVDPPVAPHAAAMANGSLRWRGLLFGRPDWRVDTDGRREAVVPGVTEADLWTVTFPPTHGVSPAAIEAIVAAVAPVGELRVGRLLLRPGAQRADLVRGSADGRRWSGIADGEAVFWADQVG